MNIIYYEQYIYPLLSETTQYNNRPYQVMIKHTIPISVTKTDRSVILIISSNGLP